MKKIAALIIIASIIMLSTNLLLAQSEVSQGIISEITGVAISDEGIPTITFTLQDSSGTPLNLEDIESINFLVARVDEDEVTGLPRYYNYFSREVEGGAYEFNGETKPPVLEKTTQPTFASADGVFSEVEPGVYTYTLPVSLGDDYNSRRTHAVAAEVIRGPRNVAANPFFLFEPDGDEPKSRTFVETASCNNCHGELSAHGGSRKEVSICNLCHTPDNIDPETGNSLDLRVLVHRIHSGSYLPSVIEGNPYFIVGRRQSIDNYSTVAFPQDLRNCVACHTGPASTKSLEASVPACTSCHDDVDPTIALNHPGRPKDPDSCYKCHYNEMEEFDQESIPGAHLVPSNSEQVQGVNFEILDVENVAAGQTPTVRFKIAANDGTPISPADMGYFAVTIAGPTTDYTLRETETIFRATSDGSTPNPPQVEDLGDGVFSYTMTFQVPEGSTATYAIGLEGYIMETLKDLDEPVRITGFNPVVYANASGMEPSARRQVITLESCNSCHSNLAFHGTVRKNTEYCVLCHNPVTSDEARRPEEAMPPVSINFSELVHKIHRGEESNQGLQVYGFGNRLHDYSEVRFPGDIATCTTCHLENTYNVLPVENQPTIVTQSGEIISEKQSARALCTSCHDTAAADGHAEIETTSSGVETCAVCHGPRREFDISNIHP